MVYLVYKTGHVKQILDLREMSPVSGPRVNSADLEYIPEKKLLIIPTFYDQRILAYELLDY
jgi:hypothetical protein